MLELCDDGHEEVCYEKTPGKSKPTCPVCSAVKELNYDIGELQKELSITQEKLKDAEANAR